MSLNEKFTGVLQGPMGSELRKLGIDERESQASHDAHQRVHELYQQAGATIFVADTFGATPLRRHEGHKLSLQCHPRGKRFGPAYTHLNQDMIQIAREVVGDEVIVAGSVAPITDSSGMHDRFWKKLPEKQRLGFLMDRQAPQMNALIDSGVDMVLGEAFRYIEEAKAVAILAEEFGARAIAVCFEATPHGIPFKHNRDPQTFIKLKRELQQIAPNVEVWVGANCTGLSVLRTILENGDELDVAYSNSLDFNGHQGEYGRYVDLKKANRPKDRHRIIDIERRRGTSNEEFAQFAEFAFNNGVKVVGGCCGTTPETTRVIRSTWDDYRAL